MEELTLDQLERVTFVILDTETTGKFPEIDRVIELGAIKCRFAALPSDGALKVGLTEPFETFIQLINPEIPLPPEVISIHGIHDDMLAAQPTFSQIASSFEEFIGESILVAHNAPFDIDFLAGEFLRAGRVPKLHSVVDTVKLARMVWPNLENHKLPTLAKLLKVDKGTAHRALQDTESCMYVFQECLNFFAKKEGPVTLKQIFTAGNLKPLTFGVPLSEMACQMALF